MFIRPNTQAEYGHRIKKKKKARKNRGNKY